MRLIKLLVDVWFYHQVSGSTFPKWLLLSRSHTLCQARGCLPPTAKCRSVSMWRAGKLVWLGSSSVSEFIMAFSAYLLTLLCFCSPCTGRKHARKRVFIGDVATKLLINTRGGGEWCKTIILNLNLCKYCRESECSLCYGLRWINNQLEINSLHSFFHAIIVLFFF